MNVDFHCEMLEDEEANHDLSFKLVLIGNAGKDNKI